MSERRAGLDHATRASATERLDRLPLLRTGRRALWIEMPLTGCGRFVVCLNGNVEQEGVPRRSTRRGVLRRCGYVHLHIHLVADAIEAAYAARCRTTTSGAWR